MAQSTRSPLHTLLLYLLLSLLALLMLFPLLWLLSTALKSPQENLFQIPPQWLPQHPTLGNFIRVWQSQPFGRYLFNSTLVALGTVVFNLIFCSLAAYPLARLEFRGRDFMFTAVIATLAIPFQIIMVPLYVLTIQLGLNNTYLGIMFPYLAGAFGIFLLRQAFAAVPKELEEAARMDGCSELGIWAWIMLPAIRPALVTLAIFTFIGSWGDFLWPLIILDRPELYTLPLGVAQLSGAFSLDWRLIAAGAIISIVPVLVVFVFVQRYIISSNVSSGIKG
ncbi:MAG: carbohydrate ABC transporter permease [Phormidium sp. BM_Day4_Bin.17]|nr:carbohydrate ABC transporter permease [Phormidium sp. BM_Day4_Bin.17]UCJ11899.1 MAG: carbohydrate ABC transporter permease [Phormidium sp. PBR-2020]